MTRALVKLAIVVLAIGCGGPPPGADGGADAAQSPTDAARERDAGHDAGTALDAGSEARWAARSCDHTLRYAPRRGERDVRVAGEFTAWADAAQPMRDDDGDGVFELTLSPNARLVPGERYAYKLIVGGTWMLDPASAQREYVDGCLNSAFVMPACTLGPEIGASELVTSYEGAAGRASTRITILTATDGSPPRTIAMTLDGEPLPDGAAVLDPEAGAFDVVLEELPLGRHELSIRVTDEAGREAEPVDLAFWIEEDPFEWRDATMYMLVVDRFANGNREIDAPVGAPVERAADFHGGDLWGALEVMQSGYFDELGVDVIWLSPINQQAEGHFEGQSDTRRYAGYHGYWPSKARDVEPRFGGNEALRAFVEEAHRRGIRVLLDLINNQIHEQHEYYASNPDWFRTGCVCGTASCGWSERPLDCLFASYLPDIDWTVPGAEARFIADAVHWVDEYDVDGFRIDAVKHVETSSIVNLRAALASRFEQGGERLFLVGETAVGEHDSFNLGCGESFSNGYAWIDGYVGEHALDGQFDFPTHHRLQDGLVTDRMSFEDVEEVVRAFETRYRPEGLHVRFLGTHDSNRMASRAAFDPAQGCRWPDDGGCASMPEQPADPVVFARLRRAFTVLYTMGGIPFLYYGDELAMPGGNDPDNRRDMVFTGPLASLAMGATSVSVEQAALRADLAALGTARAGSMALRRGRRIPLLATEHLYVYAYAHEASGELAAVAVNRGAALNDFAIDGLTSALLDSIASFEVAAGSGSLARSGTRLRLTMDAGGAAVFLGRP